MTTNTPPPPGSHVIENHRRPPGGTPPTSRERYLLWGGAAALVAALAALLAALDLGKGNHWVWWVLAVATLAGAYLLHLLARHTDSTIWKWLLVGASIVFSLIVLLFWVTGHRDENGAAPGTSNARSTVATAKPPAGAQPSAAPNLPTATLLVPDPNHPLYDEKTSPADALPGTAHLIEMRQDAANLQLLPGDDDFRPPYSPGELKRLADWELNYLREHPNSAKVTDLARHIGMGGNPDGRAVADYLAANAELRPVGPDGLHVNDFTYDDHGNVTYSKEEVLQPNTLVWVRKDNNLPIIQWGCFNWLTVVG